LIYDLKKFGYGIQEVESLLPFERDLIKDMILIEIEKEKEKHK